MEFRSSSEWFRAVPCEKVTDTMGFLVGELHRARLARQAAVLEGRREGHRRVAGARVVVCAGELLRLAPVSTRFPSVPWWETPMVQVIADVELN